MIIGTRYFHIPLFPQDLLTNVGREKHTPLSVTGLLVVTQRVELFQVPVQRRIQLPEFLVGLVALFPFLRRVDCDGFEVKGRRYAERLAKLVPEVLGDDKPAFGIQTVVERADKPCSPWFSGILRGFSADGVLIVIGAVHDTVPPFYHFYV